MKRLLPVLAALCLLWPSRPPSPRGFDLAAFGELPALHEGRVKPIETVARTTLLQLRGRQSVMDGARVIGPLEWLLDATAVRGRADAYKVFRAEDSELLGFLGVAALEPRDFSYAELAPKLPAIAAEGMRAAGIDASRRTAFEAAVFALSKKLALYRRLGGEDDPLARAWRLGDARAFSAAVAGLAAEAPASAARAARREALFDRAEPFYRGMIVYVLSLLLSLGCLSEALRPRLSGLAYGTLRAAFLIHTTGIVVRVWLQGRPPVTNLYSSAVFVGWVAALGGLLIERRRRDGLGGLAAASIGFMTLLIAHHLAAEGDTIEMMRAVLDSNFWLSTHVLTITIGYGAMFVAAAFAHVFLIRRFLDPGRPMSADRPLAQLVYGTLCAALFFSFMGTVLGGIWADQSWGRFWGWDPKENGALLIVLWVALVLHARWGGYVRERGLCITAVFGAIVTSLSWFGVNMLGVGLHSYGFMDKALPWLFGFISVEGAVMGLGRMTEAA